MANLTTLADVKRYLGVTASGDDAVLNDLIAAASQFLQTLMNREILSTGYAEIYDGAGGKVIMLRNFPVLNVSSVSVDGVAIPLAQSSRQDGYQFNDIGVYLNGYTFTRGLQNVAIAYTAGYPEPPVDIKQAVTELVAMRFRERDRIGVSSKSIAGENMSFTVADMPDSVKTILHNYRKVVPT